MLTFVSSSLSSLPCLHTNLRLMELVLVLEVTGGGVMDGVSCACVLDVPVNITKVTKLFQLKFKKLS